MSGPVVTVDLDTIARLPNDRTRMAILAIARRQEENRALELAVKVERQRQHREHTKKHWRAHVFNDLLAAEIHRLNAQADRSYQAMLTGGTP